MKLKASLIVSTLLLTTSLSVTAATKTKTKSPAKKTVTKTAITNAATNNSIVGPWMTGPLLAPSGHTIPAGHTNVELYLFATDGFGFYNNRWKTVSQPSATTVSPTLIVSQGLTSWMDLQVAVPYHFKSKENQSDSEFGDTTIVLGFQAMNANPHTWKPDLRLSVEETFPSGPYNNLNPTKLGTNASGSGSYQTSFGATFQKVVHFVDGRFLRTRLSLNYTLPGSVRVRGFNSYGGGFGTNGLIRPGQVFNVDLGLEYTLTQHWVPAMDVAFTTQAKTTFKGRSGVNANGTPAKIGASSDDSISLAPAMEYNFSANVGIIAGVWFSVIGRNAGQFVSGVVALNIYH